MLDKTAKREFKFSVAEKLTHIHFSVAAILTVLYLLSQVLTCQNCEVIFMLINGL